MQPPPFAEPFTKPEIRNALDDLVRWADGFWSSFATQELFAPIDGTWSPADHLRHLIKSNRPVGRALTMPKVALLLRFGFARRPSRSYAGLTAVYRDALGAGLRAGSYEASPVPPERQTDTERQQTLERWRDSLTSLATHLDGWSDRALDRLRLPHPGLGLLTVREMVNFTIYHNVHHATTVARRKNL